MPESITVVQEDARKLTWRAIIPSHTNRKHSIKQSKDNGHRNDGTNIE